jgi:hypothetical protein
MGVSGQLHKERGRQTPHEASQCQGAQMGIFANEILAPSSLTLTLNMSLFARDGICYLRGSAVNVQLCIQEDNKSLITLSQVQSPPSSQYVNFTKSKYTAKCVGRKQ